MANDIDYSPIEEYNKALMENKRELENNTRSLRSPFKKLIGTISETNMEMAKIASDSIKGTQDTWKGLITEGRKERTIRAYHNDEYKKVAKHVEDSLSRTAEIQTEYNQVSKKHQAIETQRAREREDMDAQELEYQREKRKIEEEFTDKISNAKLNELTERETQLDEERKIWVKNNDLRKQELNIEEKESEREFTVKKRLFEDSLEAEKANREEQEKIITDVNASLEQRLKELSSTEKFDKFSSSIKELTGGLVDIEGVLDPIAKKFGALKDLAATFGVTGENMKKGFGKFKSMFKGSEDSGDNIKKTTTSLVNTMNKNNKKASKGFGNLIKNLGITGILLLALALAIKKLMDRFPKFGNWMSGILGWKEEPEAAKTEFDNLSDKDKAGEVGESLIERQEARKKYFEDKEGVNMVDPTAEDRADSWAWGFRSALKNTAKNTKGPGFLRSGWQAWKDGGVNRGADGRARSPDGSRWIKEPSKVNEVIDKSKNVVQESSKAAVRNTFSRLAKYSGKASTPVAVFLTGAEIKRELDESSDMRKTVQGLYDENRISEEQYDKWNGFIDRKEREDVVKPISSTAGGLAASAVTAKVAAPLLAFGPPGWIAYGVSVLGAGIIGSMLTEKVVDVSMTGDDDINEALDTFGLSNEQGHIEADLDEMRADAETAGTTLKELSENIGSNVADETEIAHIAQMISDNKTTNTENYYESGGSRNSEATVPGN